VGVVIMNDDKRTRRRIIQSAGAIGATTLAGCTGGGSEEESSGSSSEEAVSTDNADYSGQTLNILTWAGYEGVAEMVESKTGATVNLKLISSDVDGFNTLQGGGTSQFDLMVLDNTWAKRNAQADNISPVSEADYPSRDSWMSQFSWPYDTFVSEGDMYAVPPRWGWGGFGYDERSVDPSVIEEKGYTAAWDGSFEGELSIVDWPTWTVPLVVEQLFDLNGENPMEVELSDSQLETVEETLVKLFENATAVHSGAAGIRQDMLQGNATVNFGTGNFGLSQLPAEGHDCMKLMTPSNKRGWYWTEGITLVNNPDRNTGLANEFINTCLTTEGQYSICWDDATSKGAPINTDAFSEFSEDEQQTIMMYEDNGFDSSGELLDSLVQYKISPQQEQWLDMWSRAKATAGI